MNVPLILLFGAVAVSVISVVCLAIIMSVRVLSSAGRGRSETAVLVVVLISTVLALIGCAVYVIA